MGPDAMILFFWMLSFKPTFSLSTFTFIKRLFSSFFTYDLNQISYDYRVEVTNRFKRLYLIDRVPEELWMEWHCTGGNDQDHPQEKGMQKGKMVVWGDLTTAWKRREAKGKGEKEIYTHLNEESQRITRTYKKVFLSDQCKEIDENR